MIHNPRNIAFVFLVMIVIYVAKIRNKRELRSQLQRELPL